KADRASDILANDGVRVGGTDFDALLNLDALMPLLGKGTQLIEKNLPMPNALYFELATWSTINFTYTFQNERMLIELVAGAREPEKVARLLKVIRQRLGHRIAFAVEDGKIALSDGETTALPLGFIEPALDALATRSGFDAAIDAKTDKLFETATSCICDAGLTPDGIDTIFFTGGSGRVPAVRNAITRAAPNARATTGSDFLSVALGLTREAQKRFA
ncbi:MAG: Hsp70 family protein, partial [Alphaproteobacteria bacterium]|nr:Hsp70 family protein [Alphaproteobacteria bacterium]